jgi:hypothetical protein
VHLAAWSEAVIRSFSKANALAVALGLVAGTLGLGALAALGALGGARADAAGSRAAVEIWGVSSADRVEIDGAAVTPKGAPGRAFAGDPMAMNAPILRELAEGKHEVVIEREGCEPQRFTIDVQGSLKRSIVLAEPNLERCAIPLAPPRNDAP